MNSSIPRTAVLWSGLVIDAIVIGWTLRGLHACGEVAFADVAVPLVVALAVVALALAVRRSAPDELRVLAIVVASVTAVVSLLPWILSLVSDCLA